jgi:large subunit ribosomal protein L21
MTEATAVKKAPKKAAPKAEAAPKAKSEKKSSNQFAVFATGGKQYRVSEGQYLKIEKLPGDLKEGDTVVFDKVLLMDNGAMDITLGNPFISGASVTGKLQKIGRGKKVIVIKYKQKSRYFKKNGHRQPFFEVLITSIK